MAVGLVEQPLMKIVFYSEQSTLKPSGLILELSLIYILMLISTENEKHVVHVLTEYE